MTTQKIDNINTIKLELTIDETNLILEALGNMPFARVYALVGRIQQQAQIQLKPATPSEEVART